jgi:hypothetical protein
MYNSGENVNNNKLVYSLDDMLEIDKSIIEGKIFIILKDNGLNRTKLEYVKVVTSKFKQDNSV